MLPLALLLLLCSLDQSAGEITCEDRFSWDPNLLFCLPESYTKLRRPTPGYEVNVTEDGETFTVPGP